MYIEPNTKIRLIKNCPLDKNYENTIYFTSLAQQTTYFTSTLNGLLFDKNTYQRVNREKLRVQINAEAIYNYNYLAFQNYAFGDRWFYAFITKIEYVNNITSEISYEIDVMQTWHFSYELEQCFVEREHSVTDNIGDNLVDEKLDTGEYIIKEYSSPQQFESWSIVLFSTVERDSGGAYHDVNGDFSNNYFSGVKPIVFPCTYAGAVDAADFIEHLPLAKPNAILCGFIMPTFIADYNPLYDRSVTFDRVTTMLRNDGTGVKNKKCLTYPYNYLYVTNLQGNSAIYRFEFFDPQYQYTNDTVGFTLVSGCTPNPVAYLIPVGYKGSQCRDSLYGDYDNRDETIAISNFPQISFNIDAFKAWLAQSASSIAVSSISTAMGYTNYARGKTKEPRVQSGILGLVNLAVSGIEHAIMPPQAYGDTSNASQYISGLINFDMMCKQITPEFATIIDDYFSMFGYATNKVKIPNRNARPEWNYIKTVGCKINGIASGFGGVPSEDAEKIENIYNSGVRFWSNPAHIGNYSYDNSPSV